MILFGKFYLALGFCHESEFCLGGCNLGNGEIGCPGLAGFLRASLSRRTPHMLYNFVTSAQKFDVPYGVKFGHVQVFQHIRSHYVI